MNCSSGSKFENVKDDVVDFLSKRIKTELFQKISVNEHEPDPLLAQSLASSLLAGFLTVFNHYGGDEKRLMSLINDLLGIFLIDINKNPRKQR